MTTWSLPLLLVLPACVVGEVDDQDVSGPFDDTADVGIEAHACPAYTASGAPLKGSCFSLNRSHNDQCTFAATDSVMLRYPDGRWTGYSIDPRTIAYNPDSRHPAVDDSDLHPCADAKLQPDGSVQGGEIQIDAQEIVVDAAGNWMVFRRGGSPNTPAAEAKYGHIWLKDLAEVASLHLEVLGTPAYQDKLAAAQCGASKNPETRGKFVMTPKPLTGMYYWSTDNTVKIGFSTYGDPGGPAHYADLLWNFTNAQGGGVVRAILPSNDTARPFFRCNVNMLKTTAVDKNGAPAGWVKAMYGKTQAANGAWLYGWVIHSHHCTSSECGGDKGVEPHVAAVP